MKVLWFDNLDVKNYFESWNDYALQAFAIATDHESRLQFLALALTILEPSVRPPVILRFLIMIWLDASRNIDSEFFIVCIPVVVW